MMKKNEVMTVTVPIDLLIQIKAMAREERRSLSNMVSVLLERGIKKEKAA